MTATPEQPSPGRHWLDVANDPALSPDPFHMIGAAVTGLLAVLVDSDESQGRAEVDTAAYDELRREYSEIEALHDAKQVRIEEALAAMKKSTSKLADQLREILEPVVTPPTPAADPEAEACERFHPGEPCKPGDNHPDGQS